MAQKPDSIKKKKKIYIHLFVVSGNVLEKSRIILVCVRKSTRKAEFEINAKDSVMCVYMAGLKLPKL